MANCVVGIMFLRLGRDSERWISGLARHHFVERHDLLAQVIEQFR